MQSGLSTSTPRSQRPWRESAGVEHFFDELPDSPHDLVRQVRGHTAQLVHQAFGAVPQAGDGGNVDHLEDTRRDGLGGVAALGAATGEPEEQAGGQQGDE
jgi:hypothetical protein